MPPGSSASRKVAPAPHTVSTGTREAKDAAQVEIECDGKTDLTGLVLKVESAGDAGGTLAGRVVDDTGKPVPGRRSPCPDWPSARDRIRETPRRPKTERSRSRRSQRDLEPPGDQGGPRALHAAGMSVVAEPIEVVLNRSAAPFPAPW